MELRRLKPDSRWGSGAPRLPHFCHCTGSSELRRQYQFSQASKKVLTNTIQLIVTLYSPKLQLSRTPEFGWILLWLLGKKTTSIRIFWGLLLPWHCRVYLSGKTQVLLGYCPGKHLWEIWETPSPALSSPTAQKLVSVSVSVPPSSSSFHS